MDSVVVVAWVAIFLVAALAGLLSIQQAWLDERERQRKGWNGDARRMTRADMQAAVLDMATATLFLTAGCAALWLPPDGIARRALIIGLLLLGGVTYVARTILRRLTQWRLLRRFEGTGGHEAA